MAMEKPKQQLAFQTCYPKAEVNAHYHDEYVGIGWKEDRICQCGDDRHQDGSIPEAQRP
jgi:hypothetical protein